GVGQQPLEPAVLGLELLQALGVLGLHAAVLGPPGVEAGGTEAVLATQFRHRHAGLGLLDESDDLLGCEATLAHVRPLGLTDFTASRGTAQRGQVIRPTRTAFKSVAMPRSPACMNTSMRRMACCASRMSGIGQPGVS